MDKAKVIQVIETTLTRRGAGTDEDPVRIITEYWALDGKKLAEVDPTKTLPMSKYPWPMSAPLSP